MLPMLLRRTTTATPTPRSRCLVLVIALLQPVLIFAATLIHQATVIPTPQSIAPSQDWDGNDGPWSSFAIQVGSPPQSVKVLISTASHQTWVVAEEGCTPSDPASCPTSRGGLFNYTRSSTYSPNVANISSDVYLIDLELQLGYAETARYGFDNITLGWPGAGGPSLQNQTVAGMVMKEFYTGFLGLVPRPSNFTTLNDPIPSYIEELKTKAMIPSLSWAYTAGNQYRLSGVLASLTLGGYDTSKFIPNSLSIPFNDEDTRDLTIQINDITTSTTLASSSSQPLLPTPINAFLDSTIPYIYLPESACSLFESAFNLTYDPTTSLYLLTPSQHNALLILNPTITITLSGFTPTSPSVPITLPYAAFDLTASTPLVDPPTRYFPLKRASNSTQYTLGRTFFQEAYLIADYERRNFSVSQCDWTSSLPERIIPILSPSQSTNSSTSSPPAPATKHPVSTPLIAGIAIAAFLLLSAILFLLTKFYLLPYHRRKRAIELPTTPPSSTAPPQPQTPLTPLPHDFYFKPELDGTTAATPTVAIYEVPDSACSPATEMASCSWGTGTSHGTGSGSGTAFSDRKVGLETDDPAEMTVNEEVAAEIAGKMRAAELDGKMRRAELDGVETEVQSLRDGVGFVPRPFVPRDQMQLPAAQPGMQHGNRGLVVGRDVLLMGVISPQVVDDEGRVVDDGREHTNDEDDTEEEGEDSEEDNEEGEDEEPQDWDTRSWSGRPSLELSPDSVRSAVISPLTPAFRFGFGDFGRGSRGRGEGSRSGSGSEREGGEGRKETGMK